MEFRFTPIGVVHSCFKEKFGIPRQPGLAPDARALLKLHPHLGLKDSIRGLENFSHLWLLFVFHANSKYKKLLIRPPRLGGVRKIGVFASRSPHRPNPLGLSVVALERIEVGGDGSVDLHLKGVDLMNGTPVLDIKPYLSYCDVVSESSYGFLDTMETAPPLSVTFEKEADEFLMEIQKKGYNFLPSLIRQILALDPRPAFKKKADARGKKHYSVRLSDFDVHWKYVAGECRVTRIEDLRTQRQLLIS